MSVGIVDAHRDTAKCPWALGSDKPSRSVVYGRGVAVQWFAPVAVDAGVSGVDMQAQETVETEIAGVGVHASSSP